MTWTHLFLLLSSFFYSLSAYGQDTYQVLYREGEMKHFHTRKPIQPGMYLKAQEQLLFDDKAAWAVVVTERGGLLALKYFSSQAKGELISVQESLVPLKSYSDRDRCCLDHLKKMTINSIQKAKFYFSCEPDFLILGDTHSVEVDSLVIPLSKVQFFGLRFVIKNGKPRSRKIFQEGNQLQLDKKRIYGDIVPDKVERIEMYLVNIEKGWLDNFKIADFAPIFIDNGEARSLLDPIIASFLAHYEGRKEKAQQVRVLFEYIYKGRFRELYDVLLWLEKNYPDQF